MDITTFIVYLIMYVYGFSLTIWAIYFDKNPTSKSRKAGIFGLIGLVLTLFYFFYVLFTIGLHS